VTWSPPRRPAWLLLILALALAFRLAPVLRGGERPLFGDESSYDEIAFNVASGHGYVVGATAAERRPTATRGPSYVLWMAALYRLAGRRLIPPLVANCVLDVLACWLAYRIARRVFGTERAGLGAASLYAVYPPFILFTGMLLPEAFTNLTLMGAVAAFFAYVERPRTRDLVVTGASLGLCALNKPQVAPVGLILSLAALPALGWRMALRSAGVVTLVVALVMTPWLVRNARVFHEFVPGVTTGGLAFWGGTAPFEGRTVGGLGNAWVPESFRRSMARLGEVEQSRWLMRDAFRVIASDPWRYARLTFRKFFQLWLNLGYDDPPSRASYALAAFNLAMGALAVLAVRRLRPSAVAVRVMIGLGVFWTLVNVAVCTQVRYALPYYALLFCFSGAGIEPLAAWAARSRSVPAPPGVGHGPREEGRP